MAGTTDVEICSNALVLIGHRPIQSLAGGSDSVLTCNSVYPLMREAFLTEHRWNFTIVGAQLNRQVATPDMRFDYQYTLPADNLLDGILAGYPSGDTGAKPVVDFVIQDGLLLSNRTEMWCEYRKSVGEEDFPAYFSKALVLMLAADMALVLTDSPLVQGRLDRKAELAFRSARSIDAQSAPPNNVIHDFTLITAAHAPVPT